MAMSVATDKSNDLLIIIMFIKLVKCVAKIAKKEDKGTFIYNYRPTFS